MRTFICIFTKFLLPLSRHNSLTQLYLKHSFVIIFITVFCMKAIAATPQVPQWQETEAQFQIIAHDISDLKTENTLLGSLLQQNNKTLKAVLEKDQKTVLSFTIHYEAPVKLNNTKERKQQTITQYGLYQTLNPKVQAVLDPHNPSSTIKIRFALNDPILIQFRVNQDFIAAPPLLTNTIDDDWTAASK